MTALHRRAAALLAASATAVLLSSCATAAKTATEDHSSHGSPAATAPSTAHNQDDVLFAQLMIPHHEQAVVLTNMVPDRSTNPQLLALAQKIAGAQQPEIATMKDDLKKWGINPAETPHESGHAGMTMQGMVDDTMLTLSGLKGADFDALWLKSMIAHHQGAIQMAKIEAEAGKSPEMTALARSIITAQQSEIDQMNQMLQANGG